MTIETILYIVALIAGIFLILIARMLILRLAEKLNEIVEELRKNQ